MQQFNIPTLQGQKPTAKHIIYVSCDDIYYVQHVVPLLKSIILQIDFIYVHVHVVTYKDNPEKIDNPRITFSWEKIDKDFINNIKLNPKTYSDAQNILETADDYQIKEKIYFSCARFMRCAELFSPNQYVLQIDADSILNQPFKKEEFIELTENTRGMRKPKDPSKIMAGCLSFGRGQLGVEFRKNLSNLLLEEFEKGAYWFMDQACIKKLFEFVDFEPIPQQWCSWGIKKRDIFSTAKGKKKSKPRYLDKVEKWRT
jgi:lipopolysaccharide biosynthesis glycosyltransferase